MSGFWKTLKQIRYYPSAIAGTAIIVALIFLAVYAVVTIPYDEAIRLWRGGEAVWYNSPKNAKPTWLNWFRKDKLPATITMDSRDESVAKTIEVVNAEQQMTDISFDFAIDYPYDAFPREMTVFFDATYETKAPYISLVWFTPDGREIRIADFSATG